MRIFAALFAIFLSSLAGLLPAQAEKRVALVIGNGGYQHADQLANPVTDARNMRAALTGLGFEVIYGEDLEKRAMERLLGRFAAAFNEADVALVYFAGHGATFGDAPYVVPTDAQFSSVEDMPYELVPVETLVGELRRAKGVRVAILDACRDNAVESRLKRTATRGGEVTRGLGRVKNPDGLIVAYATQYLSTAADGDPNGDSPFTGALIKTLQTPGLDIKDVFYRTAREVIKQTNGRQRPEISVSFYDEYALVPVPASPVEKLAVPAGPTVAPQSPGAPTHEAMVQPPSSNVLSGPSEESKSQLATFGLELQAASAVPGAGKVGVVISGIDPDGVAAQRGLKVGDVILEVGGKTVSKPADVAGVMSDAKKDGHKAVLLRVKSGDNTHFVALKTKQDS